MIYVRLPDEKARQAILKIVLRKWPVAEDVDLTVLARTLVGSSGADIAELCRRACVIAIQESIENEQKLTWSNLHNDLNAADPVYEIRRDHFKKAMTFRKCHLSSDTDITKYEMFAQMWQSQRGYDSSFRTFNFAQNTNEDGKKL
jgi:transitional endoplasmic reticulum ATPase